MTHFCNFYTHSKQAPPGNCVKKIHKWSGISDTKLCQSAATNIDLSGKQDFPLKGKDCDGTRPVLAVSSGKGHSTDCDMGDKYMERRVFGQMCLNDASTRPESARFFVLPLAIHAYNE